jgi:carbon-monoxide dehydrogenase medium subunit
MRDFVYHHPASLDEAQRLAVVDGAMLLAGGQTLLRDMKRGGPCPTSLIDIGGLLSRQIEFQNGTISIGAGATHAEVVGSDLLHRRLPVLADVAGHIGDLAVRNRGTLGGAFAASEPAGDYPAVALALDATVHTTRRNVAADDFFTGERRTALSPGEIVTGTTFTIPRIAAYVKFLNPAARYAMVGVFAATAADGSPRIAVTGARKTGAFRWRDAELALGSSFTADRLGSVTVSIDGLVEDLFADAEYRAHLVQALTRRAVALAVKSPSRVLVLSHGAPVEPDPSREHA